MVEAIMVGMDVVAMEAVALIILLQLMALTFLIRIIHL